MKSWSDVKTRVSCAPGFAPSQARVGRRLVVRGVERWTCESVKMTLEGLSETLRCRSLPKAAELHVREDASEHT